MMDHVCCDFCKRLYDFRLSEYDKVIAHCEAYPNGIPEAVIYSGHFYPKPNDNGLQYSPNNEGIGLVEKTSQIKEDEKYKELKEYYEELDMSDEEWLRLRFNTDINKDNPDFVNSLLELKRRRETEPKVW